jgi:aspartate-semialdehyde dehydrogenase
VQPDRLARVKREGSACPGWRELGDPARMAEAMASATSGRALAGPPHTALSIHSAMPYAPFVRPGPGRARADEETQMGYRVVVAGATGNVGREMLNILAEREFPVDEIAALASRRSLGTEISFGDKTLKCRDLETFDFTGWDIALFAIGSEATRIYAPRAAAAGCVVIDNSSLYRYDPAIPLVVPEVNADAVAGYRNKNIIANPNCSTAQMVVALKPLHDRARIKRVVVATYQSVSGAGKDGMDELWDQTKAVYNPTSEVPPKKFQKQIAFNVIPQIDVFMEDGSTKEEWKMVVETKKILDPAIKVTATCVRVPVFVGHSEAVNVEFEEFLDEDEARDILREAPGVLVIDKREPGGYVTPIECVGDYATFVSRIRQDGTVENGLSMWVVSDNLRKGAALNAVQIAEVLGNRHLKKG